VGLVEQMSDGDNTHDIRTELFRAMATHGDQRAAAWATAVDVFAGYDNYRTRCAPREIRVFRLRPA
jgi:hypothetical protein